MQTHRGSCGSKQMNVLQNVFQTIWAERRLNGDSSFDGPADPEGLLEEIAERVMEFAHTQSTEDEIVEKVLASFRLKGPPALPKMSSAAHGGSSRPAAASRLENTIPTV
jgi:hypothetical protein